VNLTPKIRKSIYAVVAAVLLALVLFGVISQDQSNAVLDAVVQVLALLSLLLAAKNVPTA
jgi:uncharacterized membrane protein